ncbi:16S rRNA (cytosine(1402)-N(4))-methyltransferase RsmH [Prosthecomicrobium hirschii]|uniref:16S rRNA (cytosine(1402)-N(4))-methyltransferase RsmH n=1 Tax=Prosthecodimorpha hirschii TaxID=665126 RepID=UPI002220B9C0|nr:16S rRNA (cytosine(1402)-N(4))-methyltransferase RsmH [Prosthecomicrobium hirschii]MCW1838653.1 16S rRNA (cytosine(1402)-N(4))-methyltransferase RsmH [Prosthecomicrobium hirschii]
MSRAVDDGTVPVLPAATGLPDAGPFAPDPRHRPVMLAEVIAHLAPRPGEVHLDGTFGAGGYTRAILGAGASVIAVDRDPTAIRAGQALAEAAEGRLTLVEGRFGDLDAHVRATGRETVDGVVLDIGVSSMQFDEAERGFSFRFDGPLDMRMGGDGPSAADIVNNAEENEIARILWVYGEERKSGPIARAIVRRRAERPFERTRELADLCEAVLGRAKKPHEIHPATRTFQALRIHVNGELDELARALGAAEAVLAEGGRLVVVSFHSLEDRIVKRFLADRSRERAGGSRHAPETAVPDPTFVMIAKGAVEPGEAETAVNPRARSAKLRAARRTGAPARAIDAEALGVPDPAPRRGRARA